MKTPEEIKKWLECCISIRNGECEKYAACRQCPFFTKNVSDSDALAYIKQLEAMAKPIEQIRWERDIAIEQLKEIGVGFGEMVEAQVPRWISVKDRLPEHDAKCLVCGPKGGMKVARAFLPAVAAAEHWQGDPDTIWWTVVGLGRYVVATHWMPLPEPPKEG